ncbi:MAG: hypothetical protein ACJ79E_06265 [Anaeromyxobacteraceae bacterium]
MTTLSPWNDSVSARLARALRFALGAGRLETLPPASLALAMAMRRMPGQELIAVGLRAHACRRRHGPGGVHPLVRAAWSEWRAGAC